MIEGVHSRIRYLGRERTWKMQRKQLKSLRENISKTWRMFENKKEKKRYSGEKNYQEGL